MDSETKNKKPVMVLTTHGSHIDLISDNFDIFSERYTFTKYIILPRFPEYEKMIKDLLVDICLADKKENNVSVVLVNTLLTFDEDTANSLRLFDRLIEETYHKPLLCKEVLVPEDYWDETLNYRAWFEFFKYIQDNLKNDICFLFTTYYKKEKFTHLIDIANTIGLRNFRFIENPFLVKDLDKQIDNLILRFYTNKKLHYKRKRNYLKQLFKKASGE